MGPGLQKGHQGFLGGLSGLRGGYPGEFFEGSQGVRDLFLDPCEHCGFLAAGGECPELSDLFRGVASKDGVVKEGKTDLDAGHAVVDRCGDQVRVFDRVVETLGDRHHCHQCDQNDRYQQNPSRELVVEQPVCHVGSIGTMTPETDFPLVHWVNEPRVMYLSRVVRG